MFLRDYQKKYTNNKKIIDLQLDKSANRLIVHYNIFPHPDERKFPPPGTIKEYSGWYYDENFDQNYVLGNHHHYHHLNLRFYQN